MRFMLHLLLITLITHELMTLIADQIVRPFEQRRTGGQPETSASLTCMADGLLFGLLLSPALCQQHAEGDNPL